MEESATKPLSRFGKGLVVLFFIFLAAFGAHVEQRSAFLSRRMGDLDVFLRAAWAVRNDADLYAITSDNDWHYLYPPFYAILLTPLADPPPGADASGYVPYPISVAIVLLINVLSLFLAAHVLASALEERAADASFQTQPRFCQRWWGLRMWPVVICCLPIGHTLMRGQVNIFVLAPLCAAMAGWMRQQNFRAGLWLSLAICIKVIPVYLLVYPLWKRDGRALLGCSAGCFAGLVLLPLLTLGPTRTMTTYETYAKAFFGGFLLNVTDDSRTNEELATTDSIGVKNALHNWMYTGPEKYTTAMHPACVGAYVLLGLMMTFVTIWNGPRRQAEPPPDNTALQLGSLIFLMAIFSPVCHMHYLLFCMPIVMSILARTWQYRPDIRIPATQVILYLLFNIAMVIAYWPDLEYLRDLCIAMFAALPLWIIPVVQMWRGNTTTPLIEKTQDSRLAA